MSDCLNVFLKPEINKLIDIIDSMKFQRNDIELNEDTLREIFASREVSVPRDYLVFMQQYNGTHPFRAGISGHPEVGIRWFYGVNIPDKNLDLREATTALDASLPLKTIPIAETEGGMPSFFVNMMSTASKYGLGITSARVKRR